MVETIHVSMELEGAEELRRLLHDPAFVKGPVTTFLKTAGKTVQREAQHFAPVDTGRYRASIASEVRGLTAVIGSNMTYAPVIEFGMKASEMPPFAVLAEQLKPWARRHRLNPWAVAHVLRRRGLAPKRVLQRAFEASRNTIEGLIREMADDIGRQWRRRG